MTNRLRKPALLERLVADKAFRTRVSSWLTVVFDMGYGALTIASGIAYGSWWSLAVGLYYVGMLALALVFGLGIGSTARIADARERALKELSVYRWSGWLLLAFNLVLSGVAVQMVKHGRSWTYPPFVIYGVALFAVGNLVLAVFNTARDKDGGTYIEQAVRSVNLAKAVVGIFFLTTALIVEFGDGETAFRLAMESSVAAVSMLFVVAVALRMLVRVHRARLDASGA